MHKAKILMPVLALALIIGLSGTAEAAISCSVASTPVSRATATGHTEPVGDLTFICTGSAGATTTATVTLEYGLPITNSTGYPTTAPIRVSNPTGFFTAGTSLVGISSVTNASGQIVITLPPVATPEAGAATGNFTITGALVSLAGASGSQLGANVSVSPGTQYFITAGQNNATVVTNIRDGLGNPTLTTGAAGGTGIITADGTAIDTTFGFTIAEQYIDMLRTETQFSGGSTDATNETQILLTFTGIPTGVTLGGPCTATLAAAGGGATGTASLSSTSLTSTANTTSVRFTSAVAISPTAIDTVTFACSTITIGATAAVPATGGITVQATLAPTGAALGSGTPGVLTSATTGQIPRYAATQLPTTPLTVVTFTTAQTNLLVPFAMRLASAGYDTGIAIANTTADPYTTGATVNTGGAAASTGPITFSFYNNDGSAVATYTTDATSPGSGLTAGSVASGSTYIVNLSELMPLATPAISGDFTGYVFVQTGFNNAHGAAFVVDWSGTSNFTSATPMLVLAPPGFTTPVAGAFNTRIPGTGVEGLSQ